MKWKEVVRNGIRFILSFSFVAIVIVSIQNLIAENTSISLEYDETQCPIPSLTFCPGYQKNTYPYFDKSKNSTLLNFMEAVPPFLEEINLAQYKSKYNDNANPKSK